MIIDPKDFPFLSQGKKKALVYLDSASTTQKSWSVLNALQDFYITYNANIYRGIHVYGEKATTMYEKSRTLVADFITARIPQEIIFTSGTTEGINFVASTWGMEHINKDDEIVLSELEHHANILPWQRLAHKKQARLKYIPVLQDGTLDLSNLDVIITPKTKLVSVTQCSNALGTMVDLAPILKRAKECDARILIDAAQSAPHMSVNVQELGCDFLVFSGHKMLAPSGIGVLYIKKELQDEVPPYQVGGGMVQNVTWHEATWAQPPQKFEAGTPPIAQAIGLGAAVKFLQCNINKEYLKNYEAQLCAQLIKGLQQMSNIRILGPLDQLAHEGHLVSFVVDGMHAHDVAAYLDMHGIAVRAGHHCAQPLAKKLGYTASVRASFYIYNTPKDVSFLLEKLEEMF